MSLAPVLDISVTVVPTTTINVIVDAGPTPVVKLEPTVIPIVSSAAIGPPGPVGPASVIPGPTGPRGSSWMIGEGPPEEPIEGTTAGDFYLDSLTGDIYTLEGAAEPGGGGGITVGSFFTLQDQYGDTSGTAYGQIDNITGKISFTMYGLPLDVDVWTLYVDNAPWSDVVPDEAVPAPGAPSFSYSIDPLSPGNHSFQLQLQATLEGGEPSLRYYMAAPLAVSVT